MATAPPAGSAGGTRAFFRNLDRFGTPSYISVMDEIIASYDVIVVGGGHAGYEAAAAAARIGARTALLTHRRATIGEMSCNPAIGRPGIQFRILNRSKGPAVRGPRAQADRKLYRAAMSQLLAETRGLDIIEGAALDLLRDRDGRVAGLLLEDGRRFGSGRVVLTTGTFLNGLIHIGEEKVAAGRIGEAPTIGLARTLMHCGFALGRLKT